MEREEETKDIDDDDVENPEEETKDIDDDDVENPEEDQWVITTK